MVSSQRALHGVVAYVAFGISSGDLVSVSALCSQQVLSVIESESVAKIYLELF